MNCLIQRLSRYGVGMLFFGICVGFSQPVNTSSVPATSKIRFIFLDETPGEYLVSIDEQAPVALVEGPFTISLPVKIAPNATFKIYRKKPGQVDKQGNPLPTPIATLNPNAALDSALVVMSPVERATQQPARELADTGSDLGTSVHYTVNWFEDSVEKRPARSLRIINLDKSTVAAQIGGIQATVEPGKSLIIQPNWDERSRARTRVAIQASTGWKLIYDSLTSALPQERVTALVLYSASGMAFTYDEQELKSNPPPPGHFWLTYTDSE